MAFTITDARTTFTANDTVGGWDEGTTSYYIGADFGGREGSGFVGYDVDIETLHNFEVGVTIPTDMSGNHYGGWIRVTNGGDLDTKANGGIRLALRDSSGNESYWFVGGKDTYAGGWNYFVCDLDSTPDANNGTAATITAAVDLGVGGKCLAKSADDNFQMDLMHYGTVTQGITITGTPDIGTYGTGNSWEEVYDIVDTNNYGVIAKQTGSYVAKCPIQIGGSSTTTFNDSDTIMFYDDLPVSSTYYKIKTDATSTTDVTLSGFILKTEGDTAAELNMSAAINSLSYNASTVLTSGTITFKAGTYTSNKMASCVAISTATGTILDGFTCDYTSGLITLTGTAELKNSVIYKSAGTVAVSGSDLTKITNNTFTSSGTGHAIDLGNVTEDASKSWTNYESGYAIQTGTAADRTLKVNVSATKTLTINVESGCSTPTYYNTGSGTVTIVEGQVTVEVTDVIVGSRVRVDTIDGNGDLSTNLISETATTSTVSTNVTFSGLDYTAVSIRVRKSSEGTKYLPYSASGTITSGGMSAAANQVIDTIVN